MTSTSPGRDRRVRRLVLPSIAALVLVAAPLVSAPSAAAAGALVTDPVQYVHTLAGTQGSTNSFPGPAMPFGMVQFSPDTASGGNVQSTNGPTGAGYKYDQNYLIGYGMTHASQGCGMGGDFPILPTSYDNLTATSNTQAPWAQKLALDRTSYPETGERATTRPPPVTPRR